MMRAFAYLTIAAALAAAPLAFTAPAANAAKGTKVCKHKTASGKIKTWRCGKDQPCCSAGVDRLLHVRIEDARLPVGRTVL